MSVSELACSYACLILHDDGIPITAEKIVQLVKAANVEIESYWPGLFASLAAKRNIEDIIVNMGSVGGGACAAAAVSAPAAGAGAAANAPPAQEKKKEEPQEESDEDMGFSLFD